MKEALTGTELPRRDAAIVISVTAMIVALIVLWISQAAGAPERVAPLEPTPEEATHPTTFVLAGE